jgi:hypothetical protein
VSYEPTLKPCVEADQGTIHAPHPYTLDGDATGYWCEGKAADAVDNLQSVYFGTRLLLVEVTVPAVMDAEGEVIGLESDVQGLIDHLKKSWGQVRQVVHVPPGAADEANMDLEHPFAHQLLEYAEFEKVRKAYEQIEYLRANGWTVTPPSM